MDKQFYIIVGIFLISLVLVVLIHIFVFRKLKYQDTTKKIWKIEKFLIEAARLLKRKSQNFAIVQFNIANFRYLNDSYGHKTGDKVLSCFADCLKHNLTSKEELYCSIWGDSFAALLLYNNSTQEIESRIYIMANIFYERVKEICNFKCILKAGVTISNPHSKNMHDRDARNLIEKSNHVLSSIKDPYTTTINFFTSQHQQSINFYKTCTKSIYKALKNGELCPFFQPKYNIYTGRICGAEALARWIKSKNSIELPNMFIPYCEKSGFIKEIDKTIFKQTCAFLHERLKAGKPVVPISSNFSRLHAQNPNFSDYIYSITEKYEIPTNLIEIELTETIAFEHKDAVFKNFTKLREKGFIVAIDDFGSGYSSLSILEQLNIDVIKMDQSFLCEKVIGLREFEVLSSMIALAKKLGLTVICEGVETPEHVLSLDEAGCEIAQGFFYSRAISKEKFGLELDAKNTDANSKETVKHLKKSFMLSFVEELQVVEN